jgi:hypothetical protein
MSKYNLGIVKTSLLSNLNETASIKQFVNLLKESPLLKLEYSIFENIASKHIPNEDLAIKYIDENIKLLKDAGFTRELFEAENKKFLPLVEGVKFSNTDKKELFEKIHTLLYESLPGKRTTNVNKLHDAFALVLEYVKTNTPNVIVETVELPAELAGINANEFIVGKSIEAFNEKYADILSEDEVIVLKSVIAESTSAKETAFNLIKENAISFLNEFITELKGKEDADINEQREVSTYIERTNQSIEAINKMKFNESTYLNDVTKLIDFKN